MDDDQYVPYSEETEALQEEIAIGKLKIADLETKLASAVRCSMLLLRWRRSEYPVSRQSFTTDSPHQYHFSGASTPVSTQKTQNQT